jgi:hypothetical protein
MAKVDTKSLVMSDFNLHKLTTQDLSKHLAASIDIGENIAIFGRRGTGKTEIAKQEVAKAEFVEAYMNISVLERVDMGGYPNIMAASQNNKFVDFMLPEMYRKMIEGPDPVVAILDEVDKADPSLWAPLLEFTQFRSINGKRFPFLRAIVMTGNLISEGGSRPSLPLLDRCEKYLVEADVPSWLNWSGKSGKIHPSITAFINDNPTMLMGAVDPEDRYADSSPRGWARASNIIYQGEKRGWDINMLNHKVHGCVGKQAGILYKNYYAYYQELLPLIAKIFDGENVKREYNELDTSKRLITCMIACARLAAQLDKVEDGGPLPPAVKSIGKFFSNVDHENVLVAVRSQIQVARLVKFNLDDHPDWEAILNMINDKVAT